MADMRPTRRRGGRAYSRYETRQRSEVLAATNRRYRDPISYLPRENITREEWRRAEELALAAELVEMTEQEGENRLRRQTASISQDLSTLGMYNPGVS